MHWSCSAAQLLKIGLVLIFMSTVMSDSLVANYISQFNIE